MDMKKIVLLAALFLNGCASTMYNYTPSVTNISKPPLWMESKAYIGDQLLTQGVIVEHDALYIKNNSKISMVYTIGAGLYPKIGEDKTIEYFKIDGGQGYGSVARSGLSDPISSIGAYKNHKELCVVTIYSYLSCNNKFDYEIRKISTSTDKSFQQTLIYNGKVGNKINIAYREFSNDMARPAYSNSVEYDLSESNIIAYKSARIEVVEANNQYIKYVVISNFN